ncbi:hypothetical protein BDR06DRAFT_784744 [Suillus hirtellus]|nr:hypothetical protein BDR06DRAFT_784744 [Suillus hirtellus]
MQARSREYTAPAPLHGNPRTIEALTKYTERGFKLYAEPCQLGEHLLHEPHEVNMDSGHYDNRNGEDSLHRHVSRASGSRMRRGKPEVTKHRTTFWSQHDAKRRERYHNSNIEKPHFHQLAKQEVFSW